MQTDHLVAAVVLIALLIAFAGTYFNAARERRADRDFLQSAVTTAYFEDRVRETIGGKIAGVLLALLNIGLLIYFIVGARNVLQEISTLLLWIGLNVLLGLAMVLGRRHDYVRREPRARQEPFVDHDR